MIYAIQCGENGPIKLGRAVNPRKRLSELQVSNHEQLTLLASQETLSDEISERWMHERFAVDRIRGEWFKPSAAVLEQVEDMKLGSADSKTSKWHAQRIVDSYKAHMRKYDLLRLYHLLKRLAEPKYGSA